MQIVLKYLIPILMLGSALCYQEIPRWYYHSGRIWDSEEN